MTIELIIPVAGNTECQSPAQLPAVTSDNAMVRDPLVLDFLQALSRALLGQPGNKAFPELVALGFWLRPAQLEQMLDASASGLRKPLGLVVHYTPANVDTMFVYSWVCALLMGNRNIVRLSQAASLAKQALLDTLSSLLQQPQWQPVALANQFIFYDKQDAHTGEALSMLADGRVIWGGDDSVRQIRSLPQRPRCRDISFADRYSVSVIHGDTLTSDNLLSLSQALWRDLAPYQQQACSSPRIVYWLGDTELQQRLFEQVEQLAAAEARPANQTNEQLVFSQWLQASGSADRPLTSGALWVLPTTRADAIIDEHPGYHIVLLQELAELSDLAGLLRDKVQTISYAGIDKPDWIKFMQAPSINGVERIVPLGQALTFTPVWDGYDLFSELSRRVTVA
ncbi:acyl-CoA reductase [Alteromonas sp. CYL-A6]|uniref:acyl-CoA reductase n=1 Tax=Alteromonas nitratireducens TaxID=3390813 RepID=UPI0034C10742